jgi:tRNA G18 (ribose-2'-O)-methylase SpoU
VDYRDLTDVVRRRSIEPGGGFFIAEGAWVVQRALSSGYPLRTVLVEPRWLPTLVDLLPADAVVYTADVPVLEAVTGYHVHRGALASFGRLPVPSVSSLAAQSTRVVVLEQVNNPTNVGAVFRAAAGLGMDGVLLDPTSADPLYRRAVRVSMGAVLQLPYARAEAWPGDLDLLRASGFRLLALTPAPDAVDLRSLSFTASDKVALMLGAEGPGLTAPALQAGDLAVRIPMHHGVASLNVAAAAAVACYALAAR